MNDHVCETWSLTLREECKLRVFENRVLMRMFELNRNEVTGGWRQLHNRELRDSYSSLSMIRMIKSSRMRWAGHVARWGNKRNRCMLLVGKPERNRLLGRPKCGWVDNNEMDVAEVEWGGVGCIGMAWDKDNLRGLANAIMNLRFP
jgi:hypothetical protein